MRPCEVAALLAASLLAACGAEVAGTAATAAKLQASQAEQAKITQEQFKAKLEAALQAGQAAASAADGQ